MKQKKLKLIFSIISAVISVVFASVLLRYNAGFSKHSLMTIAVLGSFVIYLIECVFVMILTKRVLSPTILFLLAYYLFQNGQLLLYVSGSLIDDFYIVWSLSNLLNIAIFSSISNTIAGFAAIIMSKNDEQIKKTNKTHRIDRHDKQVLADVSMFAFLVCAALTTPLVLRKLILVMREGYEAVRDFEGTVSSIMTLIEYMFVPFGLLVLVYTKSKGQKLFAKTAMIAWLTATTVCGDRTTGIAGLLVVILVDYLREKRPLLRNIKAAGLALYGFILMRFSRVVVAIRGHEEEPFLIIDEVKRSNMTPSIPELAPSSFDRNILDSENIFIKALKLPFVIIAGFLQELGFSFFPMNLAFTVLPRYEDFLWGMGYLNSFISGMLPASIFPIGSIVRNAHIYETWQKAYFPEFHFGIGFSLNAEAYANFGWFGLLALLPVCLIIFYFLQNRTYSEDGRNFGIYQVCILLFAWFTLPRRTSYYIWNAILYCIIAVKVYMEAAVWFKTKFMSKS